MNKTILIVIIVLAVIVGGYFLLRGGYRTPAPVTPEAEIPASEIPPTAVKEITVSGTEFSFSPSSIAVSAGERIKLTFQNNGGAPHNLVIEGLGAATRTIGSGKTDTIEFTVPASGTYAIFCSVSGHRAAGMTGSLKVE